jgi:hypothetical protein
VSFEHLKLRFSAIGVLEEKHARLGLTGVEFRVRILLARYLLAQ